MASYTYPTDFNGTLWTIIDGNIYISPQGDDSNGDGSPAMPYRSIQHACNSAFEGEKLVIGSGIYREAIYGLQKSLLLSAEGEVILDGTALPEAVAFSNMGTGFQTGIIGMTIRNYHTAIEGALRKVLHCKIIDSDITNYSGLLEYCLLKNGSLTTNDRTDMVNCTLINMQCGENATASDQFSIIANTYIDESSRIEVQGELIKTWDYCYIGSGAVLQVNGVEFITPESLNTLFPEWLFNSVNGNPGFQNPETNDYTVHAESALLGTGMQGHYIGALGQSLYIGAEILENAELTNVELTENTILEIIDEADFSGTITTAEIDLGKLTIINNIGVSSDQDLSNPLNGRVDYDNTMRASNISTYKMRFSSIPNDLENKEFQEFAWFEPPMVDQNGRGNGDPAFQRSNGAMVIARYIQIKATIQTFQAFGLLTESDGFLLQEDDDLMLL